MTFIHVETLRGLRLPDASPHRREHVLPPQRRDADYLARYDDRTLFYDAVALDARRVLVTAPVPYNLQPLLEGGFRWDGKPARRPGIWQNARTEQLLLRRTGDRLEFDLDGSAIPVHVRASVAHRFAGLNALVVVNKDNDLDWIRGWLGYYIRAHGLQALVVYDNGSVRYAPEELAAAAAETGLEAVAVYSAPFPYGPPVKDGPAGRNGRLLQTSLLNLARRDVLSGARAVLNVDVDEIVHVQDGASVFDMAAAKRFGFVKVHGSWVYPAEGSELPAPHKAHIRRGVPDHRCNQKWCTRPGSLLSRLGWTPHRVGERFVRLQKASDAAWLYHCKATSTGWKKKRFDLPKDIMVSPELQSFFSDWP